MVCWANIQKAHKVHQNIQTIENQKKQTKSISKYTNKCNTQKNKTISFIDTNTFEPQRIPTLYMLTLIQDSLHYIS